MRFLVHSDGVPYLLTIPETFIDHWGIKGMRWGVRRTEEQLKAARGASEDHIATRKLLSRKIDTLTNEELKTLTARLSLESNALKNRPKPQSQVRAEQFVKLAKTANDVYSALESPLGKKIQEILGVSKPATKT